VTDCVIPGAPKGANPESLSTARKKYGTAVAVMGLPLSLRSAGVTKGLAICIAWSGLLWIARTQQA